MKKKHPKKHKNKVEHTFTPVPPDPAVQLPRQHQRDIAAALLTYDYVYHPGSFAAKANKALFDIREAMNRFELLIHSFDIQLKGRR